MASERHSHVGIEAFEITIPTISKYPSLVIMLTSPNENILRDALTQVLSFLAPYSLQTTHYTNPRYIFKDNSVFWSSVIITTIRTDVDVKTLLSDLELLLRSIRDIKFEIVPYTRIFKNLYVVPKKPLISTLHGKAYILPETILTAFQNVVPMVLHDILGRGFDAALRYAGQRVGKNIYEFLREYVTKDELHGDRFYFLYSLILFAFYTDQIPLCSNVEKTDSSIIIKLSEDIKPEKLKEVIRHLIYGIIEELIKSFGFEVLIKGEEYRELIVNIDGKEITIRIE